MSLVKCKECGHEVSTNAVVCPNCGEPQSDSKKESQEITADKLVDKASEPNKKKPKSGCLTAVLSLVFVILVIFVVVRQSCDSGDIETAVTGLDAVVKFSGTQFVITNKGASDWVNVKMEINGGIIRGGYALKHWRIGAGQTHTAGALTFAKGDGTRFNPLLMKPRNFDIYTLDENGIIKGSWHGGWD